MRKQALNNKAKKAFGICILGVMALILLHGIIPIPLSVAVIIISGIIGLCCLILADHVYVLTVTPFSLQNVSVL